MKLTCVGGECGSEVAGRFVLGEMGKFVSELSMVIPFDRSLRTFVTR